MKYTVTTFKVAFLAFCLAAFQPAGAAGFQSDPLYAAHVPVANQDAADVQKALKATLAKVLVRVTGKADIQSSSGVDKILDRASELVSRYGFDKTEQGLELQARFDPEALNRALQKHDLPLWGRARPKTLLWLVVYNHGNRSLVRHEQASEQVSGLLDRARARGLPLIFPAEEQSRKLEPADITGGFRQRIRDASGAYATRHVVFGQVAPAGSGWRGSINLMVSGKVTKQWRLTGESRQNILQRLANTLADYYAARFTIEPSREGTAIIRVTVSHLENLDAYARVSKYLKSLGGVSQARIARMEGQTGIFRVTSDRGRKSLARTISLQPELERSETAPDRTGGRIGDIASASGSRTGYNQPLHYRYHP